MSDRITAIEGIGAAEAERLVAAGIKTTDELLEQCATPAGRKRIAEQTRLTEAQLLQWTNMADLMRVPGIGGQYAELLEAAGVDTIKELRNRNAENLTAKLQAVNDDQKLSGNVPALTMVQDWIQKSRLLVPKITY